MCGIFAVFNKSGVARARIDSALSALRHRGPDDTGIWVSDSQHVVLGHTRLSVIGLSNGTQPMSSSDGRVHVVVNGEFYGYREVRSRLGDAGFTFATDSDSEILLHLYLEKGMQAVSELRGEFSALIVDERNGTAVALRDRFGIKPLYYSVHDGGVFFASEIKALLALGVPAAWDIEATLAGNYRSSEKTEFRSVSSVPPGCYAIVRNGTIQLEQYWDFQMPSQEELARDTRNEVEVVDAFREMLLDSIRQRLVADTEVGCYLSGGIDSCAVLGFAQQLSARPVRAFCVSFQNPLYDESSLARKQADHVGALYQPVNVTARDLADAYPDAVWHAETPMMNAHGVAKYLLSRAVYSEGIKVVLTGEGADEMLGGYLYSRIDAVLESDALDDAGKQACLDSMLGTNSDARARLLQDNESDPETNAIRELLGWMPAGVRFMLAARREQLPFLNDECAALARNFSPVLQALEGMHLKERISGRDQLNQSLYVNAKIALPNQILTYLGDRMEMANSVEGRLPFLDHRVAAFCANLPVKFKVNNTREKYVLREAARDVVLPEVYERTKHPFIAPPARHADDPMLEFFADTLASRAAREQPFFDIAVARRALAGYVESTHAERLSLERTMQRIASIILMQERFGLS